LDTVKKIVKTKHSIKLMLIALFCLGYKAPGLAQVDVEAVAQFYFKLQKTAPAYVEGFRRIVNGTVDPYVSHRSQGARDSAVVARTTDGTSMITWRTAAIPATFDADSVNLVWVAGFGNNQGAEKFQLDADEKFLFEFLTSNEPHWRISGSNGGHLSFTAISTSRWGAYLGYMVLTLPTAALKKNDEMTLRVIGAASENEVWYRTYTYRDVLPFIRANEMKQVYEAVEFWNFGEITVKLVADAGWAGQPIRAFSDNKLLSECPLLQQGNLAKAEMSLPVEMQQQAGQFIQFTLAEQTVASLNIEALTGQRVQAFLEEELVFGQYIFKPGEFPAVNWKRPAMVDNELGKFRLATRFYDRHQSPVTTAATPGRYAAVVEGKTPAGFVVRRYVTLFCTPAELEQQYNLDLREAVVPGLRSDVWQSQRREIEAAFSGYLHQSIIHQPEAAVWLAGLTEMPPTTDGIDSPKIRDRQWWIAFKNKQQQVKKETPVLTHLKNARKTLIENPAENRIFSAADQQRIREVCRGWATDAAEPLVTLVAVNGTIVFHEAFGTKTNGEAMTCTTPTWMASITKLLTGVLLMQFADQGLVQLDEPIEHYLPELAGNDSLKLTLRHLLNHTAGLGWHGEWASDWNPALENYLAHCLPYLKIGSIFEYNRAGYAITGKILERITGKAVPYLFDEYLLKPLEMNHTFVDNTYGSMYATCLDLARLGQMLLNRGVYGQFRFFSEESYHKMLPQKLPHSEKTWGIGTAPLGGHGLSNQTFGHEAASGAIFRIDPVHHLIIVSARDRIGPNYEQYAQYVAQLIHACTAPLK
jgi:CubicO group peptidase (beta-lactamase class C family)